MSDQYLSGYELGMPGVTLIVPARYIKGPNETYYQLVSFPITAPMWSRPRCRYCTYTATDRWHKGRLREDGEFQSCGSEPVCFYCYEKQRDKVQQEARKEVE